MSLALRPDPEVLAQTVPWFGQLPPEARAALLAEMEPIALPGGATLFQSGAPSDALFIVASGCLGAFAPDDPHRAIGQVVAGETVGETGLITGRPRSATIRALRDSELLRLSRTAYDSLSLREPMAVMTMARLALERASSPSPQRHSSGPRTIAVLPQTQGCDARAFAEALGDGLAVYGSCALIDAGEGEGRDPAYFGQLEARHRYVIYVANERADAWRELALRQADALVLVAGVGTQAAPWSECVRGVAGGLPRPEHLILLHAGKPRQGAARRWQKQRPGARVHHRRSPADVPRIARLIVGKAMTLVLSGGGARGFAHLGVIKALREAGIAIDAVGGTSIGGIIAAGVACDWSVEEMIANFRRCFVDTNPLSEWTLPLVSLKSGRKISRLLKETFGEREIEDLALPYFCVSANLTDGRAAVHRTGPLWQWLRASVAIPGVLPPVFQGGQVYVDGGVINNLPVDIMRESQRGEIIASDIGGDHAVASTLDEIDLPPWWQLLPELFGKRKRPGMLQLLLRAGMVNSGAATLAARNACTLLFMPPLGDIDLLEWQAFDRAIDIGYAHAIRTLGGSFDSMAAHPPVVL